MRAVLYSATRNLYQDLIVSMKSLLYHTKVDKVYCFIEDDELPYELPDFVKTINVTNQRWLIHNGANWVNNYSWMVLMRAIAFKFIDEPEVFSIDCDTIVRKDISAVFSTNISEYCFAAVQEDHTNLRTFYPYYNFGVSILNLEKIKQYGELIIDLINEAPFGCPEQDIMQIVCKGQIMPVKNIYNAGFCTGKYNEEDVHIRHYIGQHDKKTMYASDEYRKYLFMPWEEVLENKDKE